MDTAKTVTAKLKSDSRLPQNQFPKWAASNFRGWKLQLTSPGKFQKGIWHLSVSWTYDGPPNEDILQDILKHLGTSEKSLTKIPDEMAEVVNLALAKIGRERGNSVRHYWWKSETAN